MIPRSYLMACVTLAIATAAHAGFAYWTAVPPAVQMAGGDTALAAEGNAFADLAVAVAAQAPQASTVPVTPPEQITPTPPVTAQQALPPVKTTPPVPHTATAALPVLTTPVSAVVPAQQAVPTPPAPAKPITPQVKADQPLKNQAKDPVKEPVQDPIKLAQKPNQPLPEKAKSAPKVQKKKEGNSRKNAKEGETGGTEKVSKGTATKTAGQASAQGNSSSDNYKGKVYRKILRAKRSSNIKGTAYVGFTISPTGAVSAIRLAGSSGSGKLDKEAVRQVRRAAPFPPPPSGKSRSFTFGIKGK